MAWDFKGYATRNGIRCSDGRTIMQDAFKDQDGTEVPLVWNHQHNSPESILGKAKLENRPDGVFVYAEFNDTENGQRAKKLVKHKDITALSIYANRLQEQSGRVLHGVIREVSLVLAGANPGAFIDSYVAHSDGTVEEDRTQGQFYSGIEGELYHAEEDPEDENNQDLSEEDATRMDRIEKIMTRREQASEQNNDDGKEPKENDEDDDDVSHSDSDDSDTEPDGANSEDDEDENGEAAHSDSDDSDNGGKTVGEVCESFTPEQKVVVMAMIDDAVAEATDKLKENKEDSTMQHNLFDKETAPESNVLSHSDEMKIIELSRKEGTLKQGIKAFCDDAALAHGFDSQSLTLLFPEYKDLKPGAPEMLTTDQGWITKLLKKVDKIPVAKVRVRFADVRNIENIRAKGYPTKGLQKILSGDIPALYRVADPETIYVRSDLNRDDILDMTDFDYVSYMYKIDRMVLDEELATAIMLGDGRSAGDPSRIDPAKIIPVWTDDELFSIHRLVDFDAIANELQGSNTTGYFGENFLYAETFVQELLYGRETAKNVGDADLYITPHVLNKMLLARDRTGRRIYNTVEELRSALNVREIITAEQFEGKTRTVAGVERELLGILYKAENYSLGANKGGQIVHFTDFDINFNKEQSLLETRCSGMNTRPLSALVLEAAVTAGGEGDGN